MNEREKFKNRAEACRDLANRAIAHALTLADLGDGDGSAELLALADKCRVAEIHATEKAGRAEGSA